MQVWGNTPVFPVAKHMYIGIQIIFIETGGQTDTKKSCCSPGGITQAWGNAPVLPVARHM